MISTQTTSKAFFKHNEPTLNVDINRSSSVFYFYESSSINTQIHFMNYWLEKRNNKDILLKITLRNMEGIIIYVSEKDIYEIGAHVIHLKDLISTLSKDKKCKEGSIELEFFSKHNLVMPYPALVVRYVGENWHTCAHSTQRNFSIDSGDTNQRINEPSIAEEGNITILVNLL